MDFISARTLLDFSKIIFQDDLNYLLLCEQTMSVFKKSGIKCRPKHKRVTILRKQCRSKSTALSIVSVMMICQMFEQFAAEVSKWAVW